MFSISRTIDYMKEDINFCGGVETIGRKRTIIDDEVVESSKDIPGDNCYFSYDHQDVKSEEIISANVVYYFFKQFEEAKLDMVETLKSLGMLQTELKKVSAYLVLMKYHVCDLLNEDIYSEELVNIVDDKFKGLNTNEESGKI